MDFERAAIKTLFYDFPAETAYAILENNQIDFLQDYFSDIARWRGSAYTVSEWKLLAKILKDDWLGEIIQGKRSQVGRVLNILSMVAEQILTTDNQNMPRVRFDSLFRWRDIALLVGEDTLTLAYLAKHDLKLSPTLPKRTSFLWNDVLPHDNTRLNDMLREGIADVHSHFNASTDVFHLNWISLMNGSADVNILNRFKGYNERTYYPVSTERIYSRCNKCFAAIFLRSMLYRIFVMKDSSIQASDFGILTDILNDNYDIEKLKAQLQGQISANRKKALRITEDVVPDYAIRDISGNRKDKDSINIIYSGERFLLYEALKSWFNKEEKALEYGKYIYFYLLLKTHLRRDFVETNLLHGFENFAAIQRNKSKAIDPIWHKLSKRVIVQTSLADNPTQDYLETRIHPSDLSTMLKVLSEDYTQNPLTQEVVLQQVDQHLSFVVHFLKITDKQEGQDGVERYADYRKNVRSAFENICKIVDWQQVSDKPKIVGIDVAGSELKCRPEVYGHIYRYASLLNKIGRTYHAGEDFYDLVDGLRAIDEAILFLQLDSHSRIGHALALSIDAKEYYEKRHYKMLISKQALLDNCVWLYYQAKEYNIVIPGEMEVFLHDTAMSLYDEIGYSKDFNMLHYWHSMLRRGDETCGKGESALWKESANVVASSARSARTDKIAGDILNEYLKSAKIKQYGNVACESRYPDKIVGVVSQIQKAMIREISEKGIAIECCPSSNVMIGGFERYDKHPIFTFKPIEAKPTDPIINVSINTDDAGIFATNISNEYSLITLAMMKMKDENGHRLYNDETIYDYIERVRANGMIQRFKID